MNRKGDNLYAASVIAIRPKTGEIVWHYQFVPNDAFDWDSLWELILADITDRGQMRKVVMQMNRNGFLYVIDRTNGKLLSAKPFGKVNWATHVDMATGRPVESEVSQKLRAGEEIEMWPSIRGAKNWPHAAFNPNTGPALRQHERSWRPSTSSPISRPTSRACAIRASRTATRR